MYDTKEKELLRAWYDLITGYQLDKGGRMGPPGFKTLQNLLKETQTLLEKDSLPAFLRDAKIFDDVWEMILDIRRYLELHPGEILKNDFAYFGMFGHLHSDGTRWFIRLTDFQKSFPQYPTSKAYAELVQSAQKLTWFYGESEISLEIPKH